MLDNNEAPTNKHITYIAIPIIEHTNPAIAIPFPAFLVARATPPNIIEIIPQGIHMYTKQKNTNDIIPSTIEAIDNPFDSDG